MVGKSLNGKYAKVDYKENHVFEGEKLTMFLEIIVTF